MKRLLFALCLLAAPLAAQPSRFSLATQVQPGFATTALGDTYYATNATTFGRVAGNTTATRKFWMQASSTISWVQLVSGDIPNNAANTTGSAAKWTTARNLAGNSVDGSAAVAFSNKFLVQGTADTGLSGAQFLGALGTGVLKNTTTTGVLSIAAAGDFPAMVASGASHAAGMAPDPGASAGTTKYLREDATYAVPAGGGSGTVDGISTVTLVAGTGMTITDNSPGAGQITLTSSGGGGGGTVATKGDIQTFSTAAANLAVGVNGTFPMADSTASTGLSYQWPGIGTLRTLKETVFAGITPASYANGSTTTIDGSAYTAVVAGTGTAIDMVATGLRIRHGTGAGSPSMTVAAGATGNFMSIVGEPRFRRGRWAYWSRMASYDFTNTSAATMGYSGPSAAYPLWGVALLSRGRGAYGTPATTTGGIAVTGWYNNVDLNILTGYPGVSTADVLCAYFRSPQTVDVYYGTYSSGWPTMESMTLMGTLQMQTTAFSPAALSGPAIAGSVTLPFTLYPGVSTSGTYEIIWDRWRITTWE
jgi:hypothetical protein